MLSDTPTTAPEDLTLHEMLRIMDVARSLREEQETVEREFSREETIALIRERLLASSEITGDTVSPEEVDAAIELYFGNLHRFPDPPGGLQYALAHLWVMRQKILTSVLTATVALLLFWWLFFATSGPFSPSGRRQRAIAEHWTAVQSSSATIRAVSQESATTEEVDRLLTEAETARENEDVKRLGEIRSRLQGLDTQLTEEYEVHVVSGGSRQSGIDRYFTDNDGSRVSGYYLIVEARRPTVASWNDGSATARPIVTSGSRPGENAFPKRSLSRSNATSRRTGSSMTRCSP